MGSPREPCQMGVFIGYAIDLQKKGWKGEGLGRAYALPKTPPSPNLYLKDYSTKGYTLIDGRLFVSECWFDEAHRALRAKVGLPADLTFQTKPQLAMQLLEAIGDRGVLPARWVVADALYGIIQPFVMRWRRRRHTGDFGVLNCQPPR